MTLIVTAVGSIAALFQWSEFRWLVLHDPRFDPAAPPPAVVTNVVDLRSQSFNPPRPADAPRRPQPSVTTTQSPTRHEAAAEWFEIHGEAVRASSVLPPSRVATYGPGMVTDGRWSTVWVEGAPGNGVGEWIELQLDSPVAIAKVGVVNGYGKGPRYLENARLREAELQFSDGTAKRIHLADSNDLQYFDLRPNTTTVVRLTIVSVYPGTRWDDVAIGEIRLWGRN
jgi:hypothetical protein